MLLSRAYDKKFLLSLHSLIHSPARPPARSRTNQSTQAREGKKYFLCSGHYFAIIESRGRTRLKLAIKAAKVWTWNIGRRKREMTLSSLFF